VCPAAVGAFLFLQRIPALQRGFGGRGALLRFGIMNLAAWLEHMGVSANQFCCNGLERIGDAEPPIFSGDVRDEHAFKDVIADFLAERVDIGALDGVDHFVRLFEHIMAQRLDRLFSIPRTALGRSKLSDDFNQPEEPFGSER
jgi:hypothetical protein